MRYSIKGTSTGRLYVFDEVTLNICGDFMTIMECEAFIQGLLYAEAIWRPR